jgi:cytochrome c peroxidase
MLLEQYNLTVGSVLRQRIDWTAGVRKASTAVAILTLLLASAPAPGPEAQTVDIESAWKERLRRPVQPPPSPADNSLSPERIALGARLFADPRLSGAGDRACATCHRLDKAFTDGRRRALGLSGAALQRNTPALWNLAWGKHFFWDGRASSLEEQVAMPILAPGEMGGDWPTILGRLEQDTGLAGQFRAARSQEPAVSQAAVVAALATYVRSLVSPPTRFDAWVAGESDALRPNEVRGFGLFTGKAGCVLCHVGWRFTDDRFHDIGLASRDGGRGAVPGGTPGLMAFKTPSLRELAHTAPYMHDGSLPTLEAVVAHYAGGFVARPSLSTNLVRDLRLSPAERGDLVAFLRTLSSGQNKGPDRARRAGPN